MADSRALFARNLRGLLKERDISQGEFAKMVGVDRTTVTHWVRGTGSPDLGKLGPIADALTVPVGALFAEGNTPQRPQPSRPEQTIVELDDDRAMRELARLAADAGWTIVIRRPKT